MLDEHLIVKLNGQANNDNIIRYKDYRITVITDRLFRIEKNNVGRYEDLPTQSIWYRDFGEIDYCVNKEENLTITTARTTIVVCEDFSESYAIINGEKVKLNNEQNLLGTARTLDGTDGDENKENYIEERKSNKLNIEVGVCSKNGVAVIDDSESLLLNTNGMLKPREIKENDYYVFAYGRDYLSAVKALYKISGHVPTIPRFALGNWWSRYHNYTDKEYLHLIEDFNEEGVPISVATVDMDWHYSDNVVKELNISEEDLKDDEIMCKGNFAGWTGYTWNKNLFKDYKNFLKQLKKKGIKVTLNLHPAQGIRFFEKQYKEFCAQMKIDSATKKRVHFDITNEAFINNYFKILHKPYEEDGVDFWWIDWQQGQSSKLEGCDPLWSLNHYHSLDIRKNHNYGLIMSRYCKIGSQRYPLGFSGDTYATWKSLDYLPKFTNRSSNVGYTWWSHDIGAHMRGDKDDERMARYCQYAVFNPIFRLHCSNSPTCSKEPWVFNNGVKEIIINQLKFRHRLVPYIYTANVNNSEEGEPLTKPIYYIEPDTEKSYKYENSYIFGSELFVAPITSKSSENGIAKVKAYLPKGEWTDIYNGNEYFGGEEKTFYRYLDAIPVLAKQGAVIPMSKRVESNCPNNPKELEVLLYKGDNEYRLIEDGDDNKRFVTTFVMENKNGEQKLTISGIGDKSVVPKNRLIILSFKNIKNGKVIVKRNGQKIRTKINDNHNISVTIGNYNAQSTYEISVKYEQEYFINYVKRKALNVLKKVEEKSKTSYDVYAAIESATDVRKIKEIISNFNIKSGTKKLLLELINK